MARNLTWFDKLMRIPFVKESARFVATSLTSFESLRRGIRYSARKGFINKRFSQFFPVDLDFEILLPDGSNFKYSSSQGDGVGRGLYWHGLAWLGGEFLIFFDYLRKSIGSSGLLILDIGANTGIFSLDCLCSKSRGKSDRFRARSSCVQQISFTI